MRRLDMIAIVSGVIWALLLWQSVQAGMQLAAREIPGYPNTAQVLFFIGVPFAMIMLVVSSSVAAILLRHNAQNYIANRSQWITPIPFICLLSVFPYLLATAL
jgi:hypothetical protein